MEVLQGRTWERVFSSSYYVDGTVVGDGREQGTNLSVNGQTRGQDKIASGG